MTLSPRGFALLAVLAVVVASIPFLPGLPGSFVFDDGANIIDNEWVRLDSLSPTAVLEAALSPQGGGMTRVLPTLSFALDYFRGGGLDPQTFKTTNIALHALTTLVLIFFLRQLLLVSGAHPVKVKWTAPVLALAWAVHPLQVSSVLYVVQRMQTMATLFLLLAMFCYLKARQTQMSGQSGRTGWMATCLLWVLALACKEDAVLLPAYLLALELTVLRFRAADPRLARKLKLGFLVATTLGIAAFLLVVAPHFWSWDAYPGRNFSTYERLLSQARVLGMYLWQIALPLPSHMPFYYDGYVPSRGLLQPWSTLAALFILTALLALAWKLRHRLPLFSFGIFLFFSGHFITSNVIGLELVFEHRNHLPLVGVLLAIGVLMAHATNQVETLKTLGPSLAAGLVLILAATTAGRAHDWRSDLSLATTSTDLAPNSARAWNSLCVAYFDAGGRLSSRNPNLTKAVRACTRAVQLDPLSVAAQANVLTYKALLGTTTEGDWKIYLDRLRKVPLKNENVSTVWILLSNSRRGVPFNERKLLDAIAIGRERGFFDAFQYAAIGYFIIGHTKYPNEGYHYFSLAVQRSNSPAFVKGIINDLRREGYGKWSDRLVKVHLEAQQARKTR